MKINPAYEQKITEIIEDMTIEEKVLQMLQISDQGNEPGVYEKFIELNTGSETYGFSAVYAKFQLRGYTDHTAKLFSST